MKKGLINEAFRLQQLAGIKPVGTLSERRADSTVTVPFEITDVEVDGQMYDIISGEMEVSGDYEDAEYEDGYLFSPGGWDVSDIVVTSVDGAVPAGGDDSIEDEAELKALIPGLMQSDSVFKKLLDQAERVEFDSDFGRDPDAWHDRDR